MVATESETKRVSKFGRRLNWHCKNFKGSCKNKNVNAFQKLQNIGGVFIVILAGIAVSMVILIFEYLYYTQKITLPGLKKAKDTRRASRANGRKNEREIPSIRNGSIYHYTNTAFSHI